MLQTLSPEKANEVGHPTAFIHRWNVNEGGRIVEVIYDYGAMDGATWVSGKDTEGHSLQKQYTFRDDDFAAIKSADYAQAAIIAGLQAAGEI